MSQNEVTEALPVLDSGGKPQNPGWARGPVFSYDPALLWVPRRRISESDRYILHSPTHMVVLEVRDDGWLGLIGVSVVSLRDKNRSTHVKKSIFPLGSFGMPAASGSGSVRQKRKDASLDFIAMDGGVKIIKTEMLNFGRGRSLRGQVVLSEPEGGAQSLACNQMWRGDKSAFRYSRYSPWYFVEGVIQIGSHEIFFTRGNGWGIFEWHRGARPGKDIRVWAAACGLSGGRLLGFCTGYSFADPSFGTENAFFVDGKLHKLDKVTFHIPPADWLAPWRFTSNDNSLEMTFHPHQERSERNRIFFQNFARRQVFGYFSGKVVLEDGQEIRFVNLTGFAERSKTRF
ncbi:MAG: DUF2804 domain-containing protein [Spirochaetes bacterium]|nr:DUF2804 domain-containing protein [Spirochaetota bacterium]